MDFGAPAGGRRAGKLAGGVITIGHTDAPPGVPRSAYLWTPLKQDEVLELDRHAHRRRQGDAHPQGRC